MLLKVDIYPSTTGEAYPSAIREPDETLYVCLATTAHNNNNTSDGDAVGRLLTVGRKTGDVMLSKDKSVSREHCIIRIVTTNKTLPKGKVVPLPARTPEEQKACQESNFYQCSIVLESVGRLGTFLVEETPLNKKPVINAAAADDSDTDEEADMMISQPGGGGGGMSASQASQVPLSTWVRNVVVGNDNNKDASSLERPIRTRLINNSTILKELDSDNGRVVVLCGKQESILVLTRMPLYVQRTKTSFPPKSNIPSWWSELYAAGAVDISDKLPSDHILSPQTTHVIADKRTSSHKQLCAWLKGIPIVKAHFLEALLQRTSPRDEFPEETSFAPPVPRGQDFWETRPASNVWQGLTYISMKRGDEWPDVVQAMGGSVFLLYQEASSQAANNDSDGDDEEEISQQLLSQFDQSSTWSIEIKGRRYTQPLKQAKIRLYSAKDVAKAVTNAQMLPGLTPSAAVAGVWETQSTKTRRAAKGGTPADNSTVVSSTVASSEKTKLSTTTTTSAFTKDTPESKPAAPKEEENSLEPATAVASAAKTKPAATSTRQPKPLPSSNSESDPEPRRRRNRSPRGNTQGSTQTSMVEEAEKASQSQKDETANVNGKPSPQEEKDEATAEDSDKNGCPPKIKVVEEEEASKGKASRAIKRASAKTDEQGDVERPAKRAKLGTSVSTDGWLQAAPSGKKRSVHARTKEEILEVYGGDSHALYTTSAVTEWAPKPTVPKEATTGAQASSRGRRRDTGPNFKAFRKNRVPPVQMVHYSWKSHSSVPAVQQAQLESEQRAADEAFQRANELFKDVARSTASSRRRKLQ